ncbi:MAG: hypothetical protein HRT35_26055, partial [Algicola sp.]|nr:hypothetical protein [Algicola sp.]
MKLLTELAEQISLLGKLKRVWFTSFNLSFEFFERHVLSTLLAMDTPRSRIDYELMQQRINGNSSPDDSGKIDIKLFVDQRMFNANDVKRTAIDVFAINPTRIDTIHRFGEQSLFHPKVIYLEDEYGRAILGVGSANLTLNGWSRNQEVFTFRKVASKPQIKAIQSFFLPLLKDNVLPVLARKRWGDDKNWQFVHSFQQESFLTKLFSKTNNDSKNRLSVWSPYFPEDLTGFICKLEKKIQSLTGNDESLILNLIPDRVENKYLRTKWHRKIAKWQKHGTLQFFSNPIVKHESSDLCHAKLWLTRNRLALGSWNFTTPGSNIHLGTDAATANIEAGIIFENDEAFKLENKFSVDKSDFMSDD